LNDAAHGRDQRDPERKPRSVAADVIKQYAELLRSYEVHEIVSDNYAAGFSSDEWNRNGIGFRACDNDTAENFLRLLPLLTSKRARLADNGTLRTQLSQLERRVVSGHEVVGHAQSRRARRRRRCLRGLLGGGRGACFPSASCSRRRWWSGSGISLDPR
jgi:hypothetical protein